MNNEQMLTKIQNYIQNGLNKEGFVEILNMIGANTGESNPTEYKLWGDYLPLGV